MFAIQRLILISELLFRVNRENWKPSCFVAILTLCRSWNLALPLPTQSSQALPGLHLTLLWPGPGRLCSTSLETQRQVSVVKPTLSNLPTLLVPDIYRSHGLFFSFIEGFWPLTHWCSLQSFSYYTDWPFQYPIAYLLIPWPLTSLSIHFSKTLLVIVTFLRHSLPWSYPKPCYYK